MTTQLLLHHGEWCAWHVLAVTGRLVEAGEAAVAAWSRSRERMGARAARGGGPLRRSESAVRYGTFLGGTYLVFCIEHMLSGGTSWASTPGVQG